MKKSKNLNSNWRTSPKERFFYSLGFSSCVGESLMLQTNLTTYLLLSGIPLSVSALVLLIMKGIDAVDDVLFGWIIDRFHPENSRMLKKFLGNGRYIPWLRMLFFVMPSAVIMLYHIPTTWSVAAKCVWFCVFYLLAELGYTLLDVPMQSMLTTITEDTQERDSIIFQRTLLQYSIVLIIGYANTIFISRYVGFSIGATTLLFCVVLVMGIIPMLFTVKEHTIIERQTFLAEENSSYESNADPELEVNESIIDSFKTLLANRNLISNYGGSILSGCLATSTAAGIFGSYYLWGNELVSMLTSLPQVLIMLVTLFVARKLVEKYDKHRLRMAMMPVSIILGLIVYFVGHNNLVVYLILTIIAMIPAGIASGAGSYMTPEIIEYGKYKTRKDCTAIQFAFVSFSIKLPSAVAGSLGLWVLDLFGWQTINAETFAEVVELGIEQTPRAIDGLWFITAGLPIIGTILAYICYFFYNLRSKDAEIMARANCGEISRAEAEATMSRKY